jgi:(p)ppGpp synthase/HD superfamily hydrolase
MDHKMKQWCIEQHRKTNHFYSEYLPYEFHLRMVAQVCQDFEHLLDNTNDYYTGKPPRYDDTTFVTLREACYRACYGHDLIEDARQSYNDVKGVLGSEAADIVFAVTNETGKTRKERANAKYYEKIRNTKGAIFVKLCDRIANVQYGKLTKSRQTEMYKKELPEFLAELGWGEDSKYFNAEVCMMYSPMFQYLINLFED